MTRTITITPVLNGFRVKVGCQEVVYTEPAALRNRHFQFNWIKPLSCRPEVTTGAL